MTEVTAVTGQLNSDVAYYAIHCQNIRSGTEMLQEYVRNRNVTNVHSIRSFVPLLRTLRRMLADEYRITPAF